MTNEQIYASWWRWASWGLLLIWLSCGALGMSRIDAGLLTSYGVDLTQPTACPLPTGTRAAATRPAT